MFGFVLPPLENVNSSFSFMCEIDLHFQIPTHFYTYHNDMCWIEEENIKKYAVEKKTNKKINFFIEEK